MPPRRKITTPAAPDSTGLDRSWSEWWLPALLVLVVVLAWANSLHAPFVLDDHSSVLDNASIRDFWSFGWLFPPASGGETVSGRPVLNLSFALNHALGGLAVAGYHAANLLIHAGGALLLYGIVRRTLRGRPGAGSGSDGVTAGGRPRAVWLAFGAALVWAVHPLQTAAVTYVAQRAESLAGFFFLLTLYCFIRSVPRSAVSGRWTVASVAACLLGMGTKETMVAAPVVVLLYDRAFLAGSFAAAWRERSRHYAALAATWLVLAALVWANSGRGGSAGLAAPIGPWAYFLTQCDAIPRYVGLVFWPAGLVFDYGMPTVSGLGAAWPGLLVLGLAGMATLWALWRNRAEGFLGASFFVLLAPSSSLVPVATQTIAEHRMYLPLATIVLLTGLILIRISAIVRSRWLPATMVGLVAVTLGMVTWTRNQVYRSAQVLWADTVEKRPDSPRARISLGQALLVEEGNIAEAILQYRKAIELQPDHSFAHYNLGTALLMQRQYEDAANHLAAALAGDPRSIEARINFGQALTGLGRPGEAMEHYRLVLAQDPSAHDAATNLGALLVAAGRAAEGEALLRQVLAAAPDLGEAHYHLGLARERQGDASAAMTQYGEAVRLKPTFAAAQLALGNCLLKRGEVAAAERCLREALRLDPSLAGAHYSLGNLFARQQRFEAAMAAYREAVRLDPAQVPARSNLGNCLLATGRLAEAVAIYEEALRLHPGEASVERNLALAREALRAGAR